MFNAPKVFINIPDIATIYDLNDKQGDDLDLAVEEMDSNIFLDQMNEQMIARWEKMLEITPMDDDEIEDRRFRIKAKVMEKLPYSYRVIVSKLDTLCPDGYMLELSDDRIQFDVKLALKSQKMVLDVADLLEKMLPLNMLYSVMILYNRHVVFSTWTHGAMSAWTHADLRDHIFD